MTDPIKIRVSIDGWAELELTKQVLSETKRLAKKHHNPHDFHIIDLLNEWVDSQLDLWAYGGKLIEYDFDWHAIGYTPEDIIALVQSDKLEEAPPPEIPGQLSIEQT